MQEEINRLWGDEIDQYAAISTAALVLAVYEWVTWLFHWPRNPLLLTIFAALVVGYSLFRIRLAKRRLRLLELGRDGERAVADALDQLKAKGAVVLHDVVGGGFSVDHVVIARRGIYAVETKTYTKWHGAEITYDGTTVKVGAWAPPRDPIRQATLVAEWLKATLKQMTGKHYRVRPVVVFPGWYVRNAGPADNPEVWVLNPAQLPAIIANQKPSLPEEDVRAAVYFLTQYVRTKADAA